MWRATDAVLAVAWSPAHADLVATGGQDDCAFIWRVGQDAFEDTAGTLSTFELVGHTDSVICTSFNQSGTLLATASMDGKPVGILVAGTACTGLTLTQPTALGVVARHMRAGLAFHRALGAVRCSCTFRPSPLLPCCCRYCQGMEQ